MKAAKCLLILMLAGVASSVSAQISQDAYKKRMEMLEFNKKLQNVEVSKDSKKQAKQMTKEGWLVAPGGLTLEKQIEKSALYQNSFEDDLVTPKFIWGDATSVAENYDAGKMQALELARQNLIGSIETDMTQLVENNRDNKQLSAGEAASLIKTLNASKSFISKRLGRTIPAIEVYRKLHNGNIEVRVQTFYSMDKAREIARQAIREELEKEGDQLLGKKLDNVLDE